MALTTLSRISGWWVLRCESCGKEWHCGLRHRAMEYRQQHTCPKEVGSGTG